MLVALAVPLAGPDAAWHIDLSARPRILLHCAASGFSACLRALLCEDDFKQSVSSSIGATQCLTFGGLGRTSRVCGAVVSSLPAFTQQANTWREFPELAAFNRACECEMSSNLNPEAFLTSALLCLQAR